MNGITGKNPEFEQMPHNVHACHLPYNNNDRTHKIRKQYISMRALEMFACEHVVLRNNNLKSTVFKVCEHEYMNMPPSSPNYRSSYATGLAYNTVPSKESLMAPQIISRSYYYVQFGTKITSESSISPTK